MAKNPLILVAEDNKAEVFLIREALAAASVEADVHVVTDGDAATKFFDATDADKNTPCPVLVLLDINLPKKSGDEVLQHLRHSQRCKHAQVLVVSSSGAARDRQVVAGLSVAGYFNSSWEYPYLAFDQNSEGIAPRLELFPLKT